MNQKIYVHDGWVFVCYQYRGIYSSNWDAYRHARNKVVHMIRSAKRVFYRNAITVSYTHLTLPTSDLV